MCSARVYSSQAGRRGLPFLIGSFVILGTHYSYPGWTMLLVLCSLRVGRTNENRWPTHRFISPARWTLFFGIRVLFFFLCRIVSSRSGIIPRDLSLDRVAVRCVSPRLTSRSLPELPNFSCRAEFQPKNRSECVTVSRRNRRNLCSPRQGGYAFTMFVRLFVSSFTQKILNRFFTKFGNYS